MPENVTHRNILTDPRQIRQAIHDKLLEAIRRKFPITGKSFTANLKNVSVKFEEISSAEQQDALMAKKNAHDGVFADIEIVDNASGKVVTTLTNKKIMNVPYYTNRYTLLLDGNEYSIVSQMRMKSGIYTRKRGNDELEAAFNLARGANFKLLMNPDTGIFKIDILNATILAAALLKILGGTSQDLSNAVGKELADTNMAQLTDSQLQRARNTLYDKLVRYNDTGHSSASNGEKDEALRAYFRSTSIDPETTAITIGSAQSSVTVVAILETMKKLLSVYKGNEDMDERDLLEFQKIHCVEDLLSEVIDKSNDIVSKIRQRLDKMPANDLVAVKNKVGEAFAADAFTKPLTKFITGSSLSRLPSQINPVEFVDSASIITKLGEGAIASERAVPFETRGVNYSYMGIIDPIAAPESFKIGIDTHCTMGAIKGSDNEFYKDVINCKTGKQERLRAIDLHNKYLGFPDKPGEENKAGKQGTVPAVYRGKLVHVPPAQLDYKIRSPHLLTTITVNSIPFMPANQGNRLLMGAKHIQQALPLKDPDKRLVKASTPLDTSSAGSTVEMLGQWTLPKSPVDGTVTKIDGAFIYVTGNDGTKHRVEYDKDFALATKTFLDNTLTVKVGDSVRKGQPLADSNFSRDGELTMGKNLRIAYMPWEGYNHEDGVVLSESAAKKLTSVHADKVVLNVNKNMVLGKDKYAAAFPTKYTAEQLAKLDGNGLAKEGAVLEDGDPVILAMENNLDSRVNQVLGLLHKSLLHPYRDCSEVYEGQYPATVVRSAVTPSVRSVVLKVEKPMQVGDKVAGSFGNKGVCAKIIPDAEMVRDEEGNVVDAVFTSVGVISRINAGQILESALGKVALKTGKPYAVENYSKPDYVKYVREELAKNKVKDKETLTDPTTGKKIPNVFVGIQHCHKLFKTTDTNFAARGIDGGYDQDESPAGSGFTGPKAIGSMEMNALLAHNSRALLREGTVLRSSRNIDFWKKFLDGGMPDMPQEKKTFNRFVAILKQAGINVHKDGSELVATPLTDKDVLSLSSGEITDGLRLNAKTLLPEAGGLFDPAKTGGLQGTKWSHVKLVEPVVNPVFADAAKSVLGVDSKELSRISVEEGGNALRKRLNAVDVPAELEKEEDRLFSGKLSVADTDKAVKRVKYLRALNELDTKPGDAYTLSVVPVTPPVMRPISVGITGDTLDNDANVLYRDLILQNNSFRKIKDAGLGEEDLQENRKAMAKRMQELVGMTAPENPMLKARGVKGALQFIDGDVPKNGYFQRKVIYGKMNLTGRATISPDTTLGLDEVGLPEKAAWEMYKPFIVRKMVQLGYSQLQARDAIENKDAVAKKILEEEMGNRPVIINRAPTLWRHGFVAAKPLLRDGKNLRINSIWEEGFNADYDGDAMQIHLPVTDEAVAEAKKMFPSQQLFSDKKRNNLIQVPKAEPVIGLFKATANVGKPQGNAKVHKFANVEEAWKAYYAGKLKMTDYVEIG